MLMHQHSADRPFHISVGAVLVNSEGNICVHRRTLENTPEKYVFAMGGLGDVVILMRESLENNETLEQAVLRGIREEFGAEGKIIQYLGSIQANVQTTAHAFEKTTLYYSVQLTLLGERPEDAESDSELLWLPPGELIARMKYQGANTHREDLDESKIIETYVSLT